jgi:hypothetical protein
MGGKKVTYNAPEIPKDDSFQQYLKYQQDRETAAEARAAKEKADAATAAQSRRDAASNAFGGMRSGIESQLRQGLISYNDATSQLRDYASKYDLSPPEEEVAKLTNVYTQELLPGRRTTGTKAAYEELLGRQATEEELGKAQERFNQGYYSSVQDLKDSLTKSTEYQDKFNTSYLDNYYDTMFGKQGVDEKGKKTGQRSYKFDKSLLPTYSGTDLSSRAQIKTPDFQDSFTGTPGEIQEQLQNVRDTRQYLYSAGLTNLQGEIDKETQKIKNQGAKDVANITSFGNVASNLVSGFWS